MEYTDHLKLVKFAANEKFRISQNENSMNTNMEALDNAYGDVISGLAIVATGDSHAAISLGQFVYVTQHETLDDGFYTAQVDIAEDAALSSSNLTAAQSGALNSVGRSTIRDIPFTLTVSDWTTISGGFKATYNSAYIPASCMWDVMYDKSYRTYAKGDFIADMKSGGGGIEFTTATKPTGTVTGNIRVIASDDGKIPVVLEGTVTPIANGGTGQSSLAGAQNALGIADINSKIGTVPSGQTVEGQISALNSNLSKFSKVLWQGNSFTSGSISVPELGNYRIWEFFFTDTVSMLVTAAGSNTILWGGTSVGAYSSEGINTLACRYAVSGTTISIDSSNRGYTNGTKSNYGGFTEGLVRIVGIV